MVKDEVKAQQEKMKDKPFKEKFAYYAYYYKVHAVISVIVIIGLVVFVRDYIENSKIPSIYVAMINTMLYSSDETTLLTDYIAQTDFDTDVNPAILDVSTKMTAESLDQVSVANSQRFLALIQNGDFDVIFSDNWIIEEYAQLAAFDNLETTLPADLYEKVKDQLYYYEYEDEGKIPIAFYADNIDKVNNSNAYPDDVRPLIALPLTSTRKDVAIDFLYYLFE